MPTKPYSCCDSSRTALHRTTLSKPMRLGLERGFIQQYNILLDYGCGYGDDLHHLFTQDFQYISGWDPYVTPRYPEVLQNFHCHSANVVTLLYVLNVIANPFIRSLVLTHAYDLATDLLLIAVRHPHDLKIKATWTPYNDGYLTTKGTFQRSFDTKDLVELCNTCISDYHSIQQLASGIYVVKKREI